MFTRSVSMLKLRVSMAPDSQFARAGISATAGTNSLARAKETNRFSNSDHGKEVIHLCQELSDARVLVFKFDDAINQILMLLFYYVVFA